MGSVGRREGGRGERGVVDGQGPNVRAKGINVRGCVLGGNFECCESLCLLVNC